MCVSKTQRDGVYVCVCVRASVRACAPGAGGERKGPLREREK